MEIDEAHRVCLRRARVLYLVPEIKPEVNGMVLTWLPYFVFILYAINRGTGFTQALFMNCDHSLLTYAFYKQPKFVLRLFQIRLIEIVKINAVPAAIIGVGLAALLWASGGTDNPLNYAVLIVSTICVSVLFSVHYLTIVSAPNRSVGRRRFIRKKQTKYVAIITMR